MMTRIGIGNKRMSVVGVIGFMVGANALVLAVGFGIVKAMEIRDSLKAGHLASQLLHAHRVAVGTAKSVEIEQGIR